jgi:FAD:protein FMN transferase
MKKNATIMAMPVTIHIVDVTVKSEDFEQIFSHLRSIDQIFSTYKFDSEITQINKGLLNKKSYSKSMQLILQLCERTKQETYGYFDISKDGMLDPSGLVKGFAIYEAAKLLRQKGYTNYYVEIAGDIQVNGKNEAGKKWRVGIRNPFALDEIIKIVELENNGIATSGTYVRGEHIYNPITRKNANDLVSMTVIGPNIYEADRFATAAFAMGEKGISFIESLAKFEGYMITPDKQATYTSGFQKYVVT